MPDVSAVYPYNQFSNGCQTPVCLKKFELLGKIGN